MDGDFELVAPAKRLGDAKEMDTRDISDDALWPPLDADVAKALVELAKEH